MSSRFSEVVKLIVAASAMAFASLLVAVLSLFGVRVFPMAVIAAGAGALSAVVFREISGLARK
jgi:hypothetical protein